MMRRDVLLAAVVGVALGVGAGCGKKPVPAPKAEAARAVRDGGAGSQQRVGADAHGDAGERQVVGRQHRPGQHTGLRALGEGAAGRRQHEGQAQ